MYPSAQDPKGKKEKEPASSPLSRKSEKTTTPKSPLPAKNSPKAEKGRVLPKTYTLPKRDYTLDHLTEKVTKKYSVEKLIKKISDKTYDGELALDYFVELLANPVFRNNLPKFKSQIGVIFKLFTAVRADAFLALDKKWLLSISDRELNNLSDPTTQYAKCIKERENVKAAIQLEILGCESASLFEHRSSNISEADRHYRRAVRFLMYVAIAHELYKKDHMGWHTIIAALGDENLARLNLLALLPNDFQNAFKKLYQELQLVSHAEPQYPTELLRQWDRPVIPDISFFFTLIGGGAKEAGASKGELGKKLDSTMGAAPLQRHLQAVNPSYALTTTLWQFVVTKVHEFPPPEYTLQHFSGIVAIDRSMRGESEKLSEGIGRTLGLGIILHIPDGLLHLEEKRELLGKRGIEEVKELLSKEYDEPLQFFLSTIKSLQQRIKENKSSKDASALSDFLVKSLTREEIIRLEQTHHIVCVLGAFKETYGFGENGVIQEGLLLRLNEALGILRSLECGGIIHGIIERVKQQAYEIYRPDEDEALHNIRQLTATECENLLKELSLVRNNCSNLITELSNCKTICNHNLFEVKRNLRNLETQYKVYCALMSKIIPLLSNSESDKKIKSDIQLKSEEINDRLVNFREYITSKEFDCFGHSPLPIQMILEDLFKQFKEHQEVVGKLQESQGNPNLKNIGNILTKFKQKDATLESVKHILTQILASLDDMLCKLPSTNINYYKDMESSLSAVFVCKGEIENLKKTCESMIEELNLKIAANNEKSKKATPAALPPPWGRIAPTSGSRLAGLSGLMFGQEPRKGIDAQLSTTRRVLLDLEEYDGRGLLSDKGKAEIPKLRKEIEELQSRQRANTTPFAIFTPTPVPEQPVVAEPLARDSHEREREEEEMQRLLAEIEHEGSPSDDEFPKPNANAPGLVISTPIPKQLMSKVSPKPAEARTDTVREETRSEQRQPFIGYRPGLSSHGT